MKAELQMLVDEVRAVFARHDTPTVSGLQLAEAGFVDPRTLIHRGILHHSTVGYRLTARYSRPRRKQSYRREGNPCRGRI